ncbi:response regulator FixJ [Sphingobium sp. JS3065]|jgi:two-component system response regulator FixJ|uniref:response regulator FixJ n=1 Tax=Sphingobium sp. JS3065 TaxID=2970925 RepID=UPI0022653243|nr:response regulator FixJ [Sphingobium sp. JS3065]UZW57197.1 response regulator FixJ [Sphingobium sp. JS3065]
MSEAFPIYVVDDDEAIRRSLSFMLRTSGFAVKLFEGGLPFLKEAADLEPGCVLLDVRMPDMDGLAVQRELRARGVMLPVVIMTGHGDIDMAVTAMKAGASDFIEKPFEKAALLGCVEAARRVAVADRGANARADDARARLNILTDREREVLDGLVEGLPNKTIAYDLGISPRTVEIHRANLMQKLEVKSLAEALRIAFHAGVEKDEGGGLCHAES